MEGVALRFIGLGDWLFDLDEGVDVKKLTAAVLGFAADPKAAGAKVAEAMGFVRARQKETMAAVREAIG